MADHALVARGDGAQVGHERSGLGAALGFRKRAAMVDDCSKRVGSAVRVDVSACFADDRQRIRLGGVAGIAPGGGSVASEDDANGPWIRYFHLRDVETELKARTTPRHPVD